MEIVCILADCDVCSIGGRSVRWDECNAEVLREVCEML